MKKADFLTMAQRLIELGEDKHELDLWAELFDDLNPEEQEKLIAILKKELQKLESAG